MRKKRKLLNLDDKSQTLRKHSSEFQKLEFDHPNVASLPWRNLQLMLLLESEEIELQKLVSKKGVIEDSETVKVSRLVKFLNKWVQSLFIPVEEEIRVESDLYDGYLDCRCWLVFKFCLEEPLRLRVLLRLSKNLLESFRRIARDALSVLTDTSLSSKSLAFTGDRFKLYSLALDCASLVFSSHGGLSNEDTKLWIRTVRKVLQLVRKIFYENLEGGNAGIFALRFACLLLGAFAKFLRVHPIQTDKFEVFNDKLVKPLLYLWGVLHLSADGCTGNLLTVVQEVLSQGLFHSVNIDGFLSFCSLKKHSKVKDRKRVNESYHRHFFDKLKGVVASKKEFELCGLGELFRLLVDKVRKQRALSIGENTEGPPSENSYGSSANKRKSLFDFFVLIMEPLLRGMKVGPPSMDAYFILKSINHLLANLIHATLYIKTEDFSGGACLRFLKKVYKAVISFSTRLCSLCTHDANGKTRETVILLGKQILVAIQYFLGIEYDIVGDDLSILWRMVLSYLALGHSLKDAPNHCLLTTQAIGLGCQLVKLYSELRQVEKIILALFKAIRCIMIHENDGHCEINYGYFGSFTKLLPCEAYAKSVQMLLCVHEFKLAISKCIKYLPEGQVSECVQQLSNDIAESIKWMGYDGIDYQESDTRKHVQAELFGGGLSELYALVLDSFTITIGNSSLLSESMRDLINKLGHYWQPDSVYKFHWIFVFYFRLFISCRSLCRQIITFMPTDKPRKMSDSMLDFFAAYSGEDLIKRTEWIEEEYCSWVVQPSASLLAVIKSVSDSFISICGSTAGKWPLIYVLHVMAVQRLVDLNGQMKSLEYIVLLQRNSSIIQAESLDDARRLSELKEEAKSLAEFITSRLNEDETFLLTPYENHEWGFSVSSLNEDSGPTAIWWVLCQNVDVWSPHASREKLENFLSLVINTCQGESYKIDEAVFLNKINVHQISSDLVTSSIFHKQEFVHRHLVSTSCSLLKESVLPSSSDLSFVNLDLKTSPDWKEILGIIESLPMAVIYGWQLEGKIISPLQVKLLADIPVESAGLKFTACQNLLSLLSWIPKGYMTSESLPLYVTYLLNLERYVVSNLLERRDALSLNYQYQLLRLLVSCRSTLKAIIMGFLENRNFQSSIIPVLSENLSAVMWLFKSLNIVSGLQEVLSKDLADQVRERICSLRDHTSQIFLTLSKHYFNCDSLEKSIGWQLAESLKEQTEGALIFL